MWKNTVVCSRPELQENRLFCQQLWRNRSWRARKLIWPQSFDLGGGLILPLQILNIPVKKHVGINLKEITNVFLNIWETFLEKVHQLDFSVLILKRQDLILDWKFKEKFSMGGSLRNWKVVKQSRNHLAEVHIPSIHISLLLPFFEIGDATRGSRNRSQECARYL